MSPILLDVVVPEPPLLGIGSIIVITLLAAIVIGVVVFYN